MFDWFGYAFMRNAVLALIFIAPLLGMIGALVVDNKMAFFSDSLGHSALTGVAIGGLLGLARPEWAMAPFGIAFALLLIAVKNRNAASTDTTISVFSAAAVALGVALLSKGGSFSKYSNLLIGDILSVTGPDLVGLALLFAFVGALWIVLFNRMYLVSLSGALAHSRGVPVKPLEAAFACAVAVVVMVSVRWVGILIINAFLVLPAAAARNVSKSVRAYHILSVALALGCGLVGLFAAYVLNTAAGASIVLLLSACYFATLVARKERAA